jgi:hypothetical protein
MVVETDEVSMVISVVTVVSDDIVAPKDVLGFAIVVDIVDDDGSTDVVFVVIVVVDVVDDDDDDDDVTIVVDDGCFVVIVVIVVVLNVDVVNTVVGMGVGGKHPMLSSSRASQPFNVEHCVHVSLVCEHMKRCHQQNHAKIRTNLQNNCFQNPNQPVL